MKSWILIIVIVAGLISIFNSCGSTDKNEINPVLIVDLHKTTEDFSQLFDSVKVTPLETTEVSLIGRCDKIYDLDSLWIILDWPHTGIKAFDKTGKYLRQYGNVGQGPGEYIDIYDIAIDKVNENIILLPPLGSAPIYKVLGDYISEVELPEYRAYHRLFHPSDSLWALWTHPVDDSPGLQMLDSDFNVRYSTQPFESIYADLFGLGEVFSTDGDKLYVQGQFSRQVYELGPDSISKAYIWDFADFNVPESAYKIYSDEPVFDVEAYLAKQRKFMDDENLKWKIITAHNNDKYRYVRIRKSGELTPDWKKEIKPGYPLHIFYNKKTGESFVFNKLANGIFNDGNPVLMDNEKVTYIIPSNEFELFREFAVNGKILDGIDPEDSNPVIATFYFKK